jgi:hypothetical protein
VGVIGSFACAFFGKDKCASGLENIGRRGSGAFPEGRFSFRAIALARIPRRGCVKQRQKNNRRVDYCKTINYLCRENKPGG